MAKARPKPTTSTDDTSRRPRKPKRNVKFELDETKVFVVHVRKVPKHDRPRSTWRAAEFAEYAIKTLYPKGPPKDIDRSQLTRDVNKMLAEHPQEHARLGAISRRTVRRVLDELWATG